MQFAKNLTSEATLTAGLDAMAAVTGITRGVSQRLMQMRLHQASRPIAFGYVSNASCDLTSLMISYCDCFPCVAKTQVNCDKGIVIFLYGSHVPTYSIY